MKTAGHFILCCLGLDQGLWRMKELRRRQKVKWLSRDQDGIKQNLLGKTSSLAVLEVSSLRQICEVHLTSRSVSAMNSPELTTEPSEKNIHLANVIWIIILLLNFAILNSTPLKTNIPHVKIGGWKMSMVRFEVTRNFLGGNYVRLLFEVSGSEPGFWDVLSTRKLHQFNSLVSWGYTEAKHHTTHASPNTNTTNPIQSPTFFPCFDVFLSDSSSWAKMWRWNTQWNTQELLGRWENRDWLVAKKIGAMNHLKWFPTKNQPVFQGITSNRPRLVEMIQWFGLPKMNVIPRYQAFPPI